MNSKGKSLLSRLDDTVRWTGIAARVAEDMSDAPPVDRQHRPLRWLPIWTIALGCALLLFSLAWPPALDAVAPGAVIAVATGLMTSIMGMVLVVHTHGPLGKPSIKDDEREAALRKDSFLFCLGLLACLNGLGQPVLLLLSHAQHWQTAQIVSVAISALMVNAVVFGSLPTLYASWKLRQLPKE